MKVSKFNSTVIWVLLVLMSFSFGCKKKADENKPITEIQAEANQMSVDQLKSMAMTYKDAIIAKKGEVEKLVAKMKEIPATEMLGEKAKKLQADIAEINKSVNALRERFEIYYNKLKEKGGDLSGLEI